MLSIFKWPLKTHFPVIQYHFCIFSIQAGKYHEALELLKTALKIEEKELGARRHRMVELFALMAEIYDEVSFIYRAASFDFLFDLILYVPSTIFQLKRNSSSWVEPVLS